MKQIKLTFVLTILMSMVGVQASAAYDTNTKVKAGTLYYYLDTSNKLAEVTSMPTGYYTGDIEIPSSFVYNSTHYDVTSIGQSAFYGCTGLTNITIPNSVTSIGQSAFYGCTGLTSITIPNSVTSIGQSAFGYCFGLTSMIVESGNTKYDSRANCNAIIETANNTLIAGCKATVIPNSVTSIDGDFVGGAFEGCSSLTSITIPNSVTSIGRYAFHLCSNLTSVTVDINTPLTIKDETFSNRANATLIVPAGCKSAYEAADYWKEFLEIVEIGGDAEISGTDNYITIHTNTTGGYAAIGWHLTDSHFLHLESENIDKDYIIAHISKIVIDNIEYNYQGSSLEDYGLDLSVEHTIMVFFDTPLTDIDGLFGNMYNIDVLDMSHFNASCLENMHDCLCGMVSLITWVLPADLNITLCAKRTVTTLDTTTLLHVYCPANRLDDYKSFFIDTDTRVYNCLEANNSYYSEGSGTVADVVDLGLSVKWASWNVGAEKPEGLGNLYAWGELNPKTDYSTSTYKFYSGGYTKYGSVDGKYQLDSEDDVAQQMWGDKWRIPTIEELKELEEKCTFTMTELNGVPVTKVTGPNGNFIYFPYPGNFTETTLWYENSVGSYWSCNLESDSYAKDLDFRSGMPSLNGDSRYHGQSIRPVYVEKDNDIRDSEGFKYINDFTYIKDMSDYAGSGNDCYLTNCSQHEDGNIIKANVFCVENFYGVSEGQSYANMNVFADKGLTTKLGEFNFCWAFYSVSFYTSSNSCFFFVDAYDTMEIGESKQLAYSDGMVYTFTLLDKIVSNTNSEKKLVFSVDKPLYFGGNNNGSTGIERFSNRVQIKYLANSQREEQSLDLNTLPNMTCGDEAYTLPEKTNEGLTLTWTVEDNTIAEISGDKLIAKAAGETTITATQDGNDTYLPFKRDFSLTVNNPEQQPAVEVTDISQMDNVIYIEPMEEKTGSQATISLKMKNSAAIRGFQFDLYLPEGVTVVKSSKGKIQGSLSAGRLPDEDEHTLTFSEQADGAIRFLCSSQYDETFTGNDGEIATLMVNIADDMVDGDYAIQLKNMKLTETNISNFYETALVQTKLTISSFVIGDINGDGVVDVSDYTGVANHIHGNTPDGFNAKAADVDENGVIDVSDYTGIANIIHTGSIYGNNNAPANMLSPRKANTDINTYDNVMYISPFTASAGTQTTLSIKMKNTAEIRGFQFDLYLPEGMTVVKSSKGRIQGALSAGRLPDEDEHELTFSEQADGAIRFLCSSQYDETFTGNDGEIATLQVNVANSMANGDYPILLKDMKLTETDISKYYTADLIETTVTIGEVDTRIILDETSTTAPEAANNVDVRVLRTINAGEWSTICLPFAMTEEQVTTAFGDDVELGDFTGYTAEGADENVTGIRVHFIPATTIEANHPYIIKVSQAVSEFTADGVDVDPEDEPTVAAVKRTKKQWSEFIGTYVAGTTVEDQMLFLSGNQFWYSTGQTQMKAFRGYFDFYDVLTEVENAANISFFVGDEATEISLIPNAPVGEGSIYDLQGRKMNGNIQLPKGIYIQNGKKVVK